MNTINNHVVLHPLRPYAGYSSDIDGSCKPFSWWRPDQMDERSKGLWCVLSFESEFCDRIVMRAVMDDFGTLRRVQQ